MPGRACNVEVDNASADVLPGDVPALPAPSRSLKARATIGTFQVLTQPLDVSPSEQNLDSTDFDHIITILTMQSIMRTPSVINSSTRTAILSAPKLQSCPRRITSLAKGSRRATHIASASDVQETKAVTAEVVFPEQNLPSTSYSQEAAQREDPWLVRFVKEHWKLAAVGALCVALVCSSLLACHSMPQPCTREKEYAPLQKKGTFAVCTRSYHHFTLAFCACKIGQLEVFHLQVGGLLHFATTPFCRQVQTSKPLSSNVVSYP